MAEQKTIGQKLYELINPCKAGDPIRPAMWDEVDEDYHAHYERAAAAFLNSEAAASAVWDQAVAKCIEAIREQSETFASEEYATGQPHSTFGERFACKSCIEALEGLKGETDGQ